MTRSPFKGNTGIKRIWNAFHYSLAGLISDYEHESAFRQELAMGLPLIFIAIILPINSIAKALMISAVFLVLIVELLNSGIEAIVDRVSLEHHELSKRAKDVGSAAVRQCLSVWSIAWLSGRL